jgi:hypothetical protein
LLLFALVVCDATNHGEIITNKKTLELDSNHSIVCNWKVMVTIGNTMVLIFTGTVVIFYFFSFRG